MDDTRHVGGLVCFLLFVCVAAVWAQPGPAIRRPVAELAPVELVYPDSPQLVERLSGLADGFENCSLVSGPTVLDAEGLRDYLGDRAAELLGYQYLWTVHAEYLLGERARRVSVDIHRMGSDLDAFGAFSRQRMTAAEAAHAIPTAAYWLGADLHVWRGPFYIHSHPSEDEQPLRLPIHQLTLTATQDIPVSGQLPAMLRLLPSRARQASSPQYYRRQVPGFEIITDALTVTYVEGPDSKCRFVLARCADSAAALAAYNTMLLQLSDGSRPVDPLAAIADRAAIVRSIQHGMAAVMQQDNFVAAVLDFHDRQFAEMLLRTVGTNVRTYLLTIEE